MTRGVVTLIIASFLFAGSLIAGAATLPAPVTTHPAQHRITEDDPRWNCLTMGNHRCGPQYKQVDDTAHPQAWIGMLTDAGEDPYRCLVRVADTTVIVCQDGYVTTS